VVHRQAALAATSRWAGASASAGDGVNTDCCNVICCMWLRSVAMTIPAWALAELLQSQAPAAAEALASFDYPPVGAVTLAYPQSAVRDDRKAPDGSVPGFGQLHPRSQVCSRLITAGPRLITAQCLSCVRSAQHCFLIGLSKQSSKSPSNARQCFSWKGNVGLCPWPLQASACSAICWDMWTGTGMNEQAYGLSR
jgi:hypothetical protein